MNDMNFVLIEGNITEEPIIKSTCGGALTKFCIANHRTSKEKGIEKIIVDFFQIEAWGMVADSCRSYLNRGTFVRIRGVLRLDRYESHTGIRKQFVKITAHEIEVI